MDLQLPLNYYELNQDEMTYLDGGWSPSVFGQNMVGAAQKSVAAAATVRTIAKTFGLETALMKGLQATYSVVAAKVSALVAQVIGMVGGIGLGIGALVISAGAVWVLGEYRMFY